MKLKSRKNEKETKMIKEREKKKVRKQKIKIISFVIILGLVITIISFLGIASYFYFKSPEKQIDLSVEIESFLISVDEQTAFIKMSSGNFGSDENITKIRFTFSDSSGNNYVYDTETGKEIFEVPCKPSWWFFGKPDCGEPVDHVIPAEDIPGLNNFSGIDNVGAGPVFESEIDKEEVDDSPTLDTYNQSEGFLGRGSRHSGSGCAPNTCSIDDCSIINDGCDGTIDCGECVEDIEDIEDISFGLVSHWKFENNANDEIGINNGTEYGPPSYELRRTDDYAVKLNSTSGVKVNDSDSLDIEHEISLLAWVKYDSFYNYGKIIIKTFNDSENQNPWELYSLDFKSSYPRFVIGEGINTSAPWNGINGGADANHTLLLGEWYHVAGTYNGSEAKIYINGELNNTELINITIGTNDQSFFIGGVEGLGFSTNGSIDDVMIYNRALSADEVEEIYDEQKRIVQICNTSNPYSEIFINTSIPTQTGTFSVEYDATPNNTNMDGVVALSQIANMIYGGSIFYNDYAVLVRFNNSGRVDVRNLNNYISTVSKSYTAGISYHFKIDVDVSNHIYDVYMDGVQIADDYGFRNWSSGTQTNINSIDNWGVVSGNGSITVCDMEITSTIPSLSPLIKLWEWLKRLFVSNIGLVVFF